MEVITSKRSTNSVPLKYTNTLGAPHRIFSTPSSRLAGVTLHSARHTAFRHRHRLVAGFSLVIAVTRCNQTRFPNVKMLKLSMAFKNRVIVFFSLFYTMKNRTFFIFCTLLFTILTHWTTALDAKI